MIFTTRRGVYNFVVPAPIPSLREYRGAYEALALSTGMTSKAIFMEYYWAGTENKWWKHSLYEEHIKNIFSKTKFWIQLFVWELILSDVSHFYWFLWHS